MDSEQNQVHLIRSIICLKKINITVRFPCSISFALKHQSNIVDHKAVYQLVKGQCLIDRSVEIELQIPFAMGRYEQRKVSLLIYMVSSNGKIPAGSVTINPTQKLIVDKKVALEKCPDKNAFAIYTQTYEKIRTVKSPYKGLHNLAASTVSGYNQIVKKGNIYPSTFISEQERNSQKNSQSPRFQADSESKFRSNSRQQLREVGTSSEKRINKRPPSLRHTELGRKSSYGSINKQSEEKQSRLSNQLLGDEDEWQIEAQKNRILKLQQEKVTYMKQISKLRGSMAKVEAEDRVELEDEINRVNNEKGNLEDQIQDLRDKTKYQQRRQTQSSTLMKQLRQELDKKKSRIILLDSSKNHVEQQLSQKDKIIHDLQSQKKKIIQSLQEEKSQQLSQQKRLEIKENSFKEQFKKLNQKMSQIDTERQKAILNYSDLLNQFQASQKKHQTAMRDKQKGFNEEKGKLAKKVDQLLAQNMTLKQKIGEDAIIMREYEYIKKRQMEEQKGFTQKLSNLQRQNQNLTAQTTSLAQQKRHLANQLASLQQLHNDQKNTLKKKCLQLSQQMQILKQKMQKMNAMNRNYEVKNKDLQAKIATEIKQKGILISDLESVRKTHQKYLQEEEQKQKLAETLSVQNLSYNQKLNEYRNRVELQKRKYEAMQSKYQEQVKYLVGSKELIQTELEQLRWLLEKEMEKSQTLALKNAQLGQLGVRLIDVNQQIIVFQQKFNAYEIQREENHKKIASLQNQIDNFEHKARVSQDSLQRSELDYNKLERKNQQLQQDNTILHQKLQTTEANYKEKIESLERKGQQKNSKLKNKEQQMSTLREELTNAKHQASKYVTQINQLNHDNSSLKQANKALKRDYNTIISKYDSINQQERQVKKRLAQNQQSLQLSNQQLQDCRRSLQKCRAQFQQYKVVIYKSLQQLFHFISRQQFDHKNQLSILHSLPDERLFKMQVESLKKYQIIRKRLEKQAEQYKGQAAYLREQLGKLQNINEKMQDQIMLKIKCLQDELNEQEEQKRRIIDQYETKIHELNIHSQQSRNEIEYLGNEINGYESVIAQLNEQLSQRKSKEAILTRQISQLEQNIFDYKEKQMKEKLLSSDQVLDFQQILKLQRQHNQQLINGFKAQIAYKQKQMTDKNEEIKRMAVKEQQHQLQQARHSHQIQEIKRQVELTQSYKMKAQTQLKEKQRLLAQLRHQLSQIKSRQEEEKVKFAKKEQQIIKLNNLIQECQEQIRFYKADQENKSVSNNELASRERQKREKLELLKVKLQQQNRQIREKCIKLQSENDFYKFYKQESSRKIEEYEKMKHEHLVEMSKCKQSLLRCQRSRQEYENKYYQLEIDLENANKQKQLLSQSNNKIKQRLSQYEQQCRELYRTISELQSKDKEIGRLQLTNKSIENQHERTISELRQSNNKLKQQVNSKSNKIKQLEQLISNNEIELNTQKQKWQVELDNQKNIYQLKLQTLDQNMCALQNELQFQRQQSVKEIEGANAYIQQLNEVIRQKEEFIQYKEEVINEQSVRLEELNTQLNQCITKWDKEKQTYLPNSNKVLEIKQEIARMNSFIGELDGRNKQLLQINKRKMQQTIQSKQSITEVLKDLLLLMHKNKTKILSRCQTEKEKEAVVIDFKAIQEKIDLTLKSTQIVTVKQ